MSQRRNSSEDATINLTPMIDVVFLLVIFFMVGSKFSEAEGRVKVDVSTESQMRSLARQPDERLIKVAADGSISMDGALISQDQLKASLREQFAVYPDLAVAVVGDVNTSLGLVHGILLDVRSTGIENFRIAATDSGRRLSR